MKLKNAVAAALLMVATDSVKAVQPGDSIGPAPIVKIYPPPLGEPASQDYAITVNSQPSFCYGSYAFDPSSKQTIQGRPVSPMTFCPFDFSGRVEVTITFLNGLSRAGLDLSSVIVRPLATDLRPQVANGSFTLHLTRPGQYTIEPGGALTHPLHIFANPLEVNPPGPYDQDVVYFGPGVHPVPSISLAAGKTLYIAGGAVVYLQPSGLGPGSGPPIKVPPFITTVNSDHVTIRGRGILCGRAALAAGQRAQLVAANFAQNLEVEGVTLREAGDWTLVISNSSHVAVDHVKILGHFENSDGVVISGSTDAVIKNSFVHNADDSMEVKAWQPASNIIFDNDIVWSTVGGAFGIPSEVYADISNITFQNSTVIHSTEADSSRGALGVNLQGGANVNDIVFKNMVVEQIAGFVHAPIKLDNNWDSWNMNLPTIPGNPYVESHPDPSAYRPRGTITNVLFKNIDVLQCDACTAVFMADAAVSPISGVVLDNLTLVGRALKPGSPNILTNQWVAPPVVRSDDLGRCRDNEHRICGHRICGSGMDPDGGCR
jgi:hypothetical protein